MKRSFLAATKSRYIVYFNWTKHADEAELVNSRVQCVIDQKVHAMLIERQLQQTKQQQKRN